MESEQVFFSLFASYTLNVVIARPNEADNFNAPGSILLSLQEEISSAVKQADTAKLICLSIAPILISPVQLYQRLTGCISPDTTPKLKSKLTEI